MIAVRFLMPRTSSSPRNLNVKPSAPAGVIAGLTLAITALLLSILALIWYLHRIRKQTRQDARLAAVPGDDASVTTITSIPPMDTIETYEERGKRYDPYAESDYSQPSLHRSSNCTVCDGHYIDFDRWGKPIRKPPPVFWKSPTVSPTVSPVSTFASTFGDVSSLGSDRRSSVRYGMLRFDGFPI